MALYRADIKVTSIGNYFPVEIESGASSTAKEAIQHIYRPICIKNLRKVNSSSSSSSDGDSSIAATGGLIGIAFVLWIFATYTPLILMLIGGSFGTWITEKIVGQSLFEYGHKKDGGDVKALIVIAVALMIGGYGFVKGIEVQKALNNPPPQIQQSK